MSHENVEIVRRLYEALDRRDLAAVDRLCHDHVRIHTRVGEVTGRVYGYGEVRPISLRSTRSGTTFARRQWMSSRSNTTRSC